MPKKDTCEFFQTMFNFFAKINVDKKLCKASFQHIPV